MSDAASPGRGSAGDQLWTVLSMLEWATGYFTDKGIPNPRLSIEWLLADLLGVKRLDLYLQFDRPLTKEQLATLRGWVLRRGKHEPLQYITGSTDFYNCVIKVDRRVLIPRPETEELVELVLSEQDEAPKTVVDFGTGSGCIAIAVKKARPAWTVIGVDIDPGALELARINGESNGVDVDWRLGDMLSAVDVVAGFNIDLVISNPPYIDPGESDSIESEVRDFEPSIALFHIEPFSLYQALLGFADSQKPKASLYCETHYAQGELLLRSLADTDYLVEIKKDFNGNDRFLKAVPRSQRG